MAMFYPAGIYITDGDGYIADVNEVRVDPSHGHTGLKMFDLRFVTQERRVIQWLHEGRKVTLVFPGYEVDMHLIEVKQDEPIDGLQFFTVCGHSTGAPRETSHPNCRCMPVNAKEKVMVKRTKVLNRFYVASDKMISEAEQGSPNVGEPVRETEYYDGGGYERGRSRPRHRRWAKRDLAQAIDHAREILDNDPSKHEVAIVRIVKMVRRKATPVIVEDVR